MLLTAALGFQGLPTAVTWIAVIAAVIVTGTLIAIAIAIAIAIGAARSETFTARVGDLAEDVANWGLATVNRSPSSGIAKKAVAVRGLAPETVLAVWPRALLASSLATLWTYAILLVSVRFAGIPSERDLVATGLPGVDVGAAGPGDPVAPGGVGFVEAAYLELFGAIAGPEYSTQIAVAVVLYRAAQWALPIVVGWPLVGWWRWQIRRGTLPDPFAG